MTPKTASWAALAVGLLAALVALLADGLGLGGAPGFGWKQAALLVVGLAVAAAAGFRLLRTP
ncbi:MAG: hypothetical protein ACP5NF_00410 [Thermoanaerobaculum sp.]